MSAGTATWNEHVHRRLEAFHHLGIRHPPVPLAFAFLAAPEPKVRRCRAHAPVPAHQRPRVPAPLLARAARPGRLCSACGSPDHDVRHHRNGRAAAPCDVCAKPGCSPANHDRVEQLRARTDPTEYSRVIPVSRLTRAERELAKEPTPADIARPLTRAECRDQPRPCPFVSCRHHLYLDVNPETGSIKLNFPHLEPWQMTESCSLDVAEKGQHTAKEVGKIMRLSKQRVSQYEERLYGGLRKKARAMRGDDAEG